MNLNWKALDRRGRCHLVAWLVLIAGLGSAAVVYYTAGQEASRVSVYESSYGGVTSYRPDDSKKFIHDLEVYGGKANVLIYKFNIWFEGLWQGRNLAYTIAAIAVIIAALSFYLAGFPPDDPPGDHRASPPE